MSEADKGPEPLERAQVEARAQQINEHLAAGQVSLSELLAFRAMLEDAPNAGDFAAERASVQAAITRLGPTAPGLQARPRLRPRVILRVAVIAVGLVLAYQCGCLPGLNRLQSLVANEVGSDHRNAGIKVSVHRSLTGLVLDVSVVESASPAAIFRVLLQSAEALKAETFDTVVLSSDGVKKFQLKGDDFQRIGSDYSLGENPVYLMRTFPEKVMDLDGRQAYPSRTGGILDATARQLDDLNHFCRTWCL